MTGIETVAFVSEFHVLDVLFVFPFFAKNDVHGICRKPQNAETITCFLLFVRVFLLEGSN